MSLIEIVEQHLKINHHTVYVKTWIPLDKESEVPIILLHDSLGCVGLWRDFPLLLAQTLNRPVLAYDRIGYGVSSVHTAKQPNSFIQDEAIIWFPKIKNALGINAYVLIGHSVGGGMALLSAANDHTCLGVVSMSAQAYVEPKTLQGIRDAQAMFEQKGQMLRLENWHGERAKWVLDSWVENWLSPAFTHWSLVPELHRVSCPALIIHGDLDEYGSCDFPHAIADNVTGESILEIIEQCGHVPYKEHPEKVLSFVEHFIKNNAELAAYENGTWESVL